MMDADALEQLAQFDAIYFGAVGSAEFPDHVTLRGLRLEIAQAFDQAISRAATGRTGGRAFVRRAASRP